MGGSFALQPGAQSVLAAEGVRGRCGQALGGLQRSLHLGGLGRKRARLLRETGALQLDRLQFYEIVNEFMHRAKKFTACTGQSENAEATP